ncbi:MAG: hypothetical protein HY583_02105 [Candidatus Omnitrophica bacterium]|nr:hypothetical protein [Candidatus Omnitrophota bacterium]
MKKKSILIITLVGLIIGTLSACCRKQQCPACQPSFGGTQVAPQAAAQPAEESLGESRRSDIK